MSRQPKLSLGSKILIMSHHYLLSYTCSPSVSVLFLRSYFTPLKHFMVRLQCTWLSSSVLTSLGELLGLPTNFYWSSQRTSLNRSGQGLFQCVRLISGTRFHLRLYTTIIYLWQEHSFLSVKRLLLKNSELKIWDNSDQSTRSYDRLNLPIFCSKFGPFCCLAKTWSRDQKRSSWRQLVGSSTASARKQTNIDTV